MIAMPRLVPSWPPNSFRQGVTQVAGLVGALLGFAQQRLPFRTRQAFIVEISARPFPAVVEEALVIVLRLQRLDLVLDELVEHDEIVGDVLWDVEVHDFLHCVAAWRSPYACRARRQFVPPGQAILLQRSMWNEAFSNNSELSSLNA
jgi:hypothetical protein